VTAEFLRDAAATAAVFGFFASGWFGWAQDDSPKAWRKVLVAGSVLSLLTAVGGGVVAWRHWSGPTVFDADTGRAFGVVVGIELVLAALGAALLARRRRSDLTPAWAPWSWRCTCCRSPRCCATRFSAWWPHW
jgi:hypothetical protein